MNETTQDEPVLGEDARAAFRLAYAKKITGDYDWYDEAGVTAGLDALAPHIAALVAAATFGPVNPGDPLGLAYTQAQLDANIALAEQWGAEKERERIVSVLHERAEMAKQGAETAARNPDFPMPDRYVVTRALRDAATEVSR